MICKNEHNQHDIFDFENIIIKDDDISKTMKDLNDSIDRFKIKF